MKLCMLLRKKADRLPWLDCQVREQIDCCCSCLIISHDARKLWGYNEIRVHIYIPVLTDWLTGANRLVSPASSHRELAACDSSQMICEWITSYDLLVTRCWCGNLTWDLLEYIRCSSTYSWIITIFGNWRLLHDFETTEGHGFQIKNKENKNMYSMWLNKPIRVGNTNQFGTNTTCHHNNKLDQILNHLHLFWDFPKSPINEYSDWILESAMFIYIQNLVDNLRVQQIHDMMQWQQCRLRCVIWQNKVSSWSWKSLQHLAAQTQ
jgi:hypothetical protein